MRTATAAVFGLAGVLVGLAVGEPARRRARHDARHDPLTGLANRDGLTAAYQHRPDEAALLMLDLDKFKTVNDTFGHAAGDAVLCEVARRLVAAVPAGAVVARLGGDEFAVLVAGDQDQAEAVARRIVAALAAPIRFDGRELVAPASVGLAPARSWEWSSRAADTASYRAKRAGLGLAVYDPDPETGDGPVTVTDRPAVRTRDRRALPWVIDGRRSDYRKAA